MIDRGGATFGLMFSSERVGHCPASPPAECGKFSPLPLQSRCADENRNA